jgi:peroxiredoxin Q/BCP
MLKVGDLAPGFEAQDDAGRTVNLADFIGKTVVLYFYPKDMTPGCTVEACAFRDNYKAIQKRGAVLLGVSKDSSASHAKFKEKHALPFPLLADEGLQIIKAYGVWGKKKLYGKESMGVVRTTYVIDARGFIKAVFPKVKVDGHDQAVLAAI